MAAFAAFEPALGYLYQIRYALYLLLGAAPGAMISIERFDDVAFERDGSPEQLLQTKHHVRAAGSLTDASTDLWRTLRIWATSVTSGVVPLPGTVFTLVTTGSAPADSAAARLKDNTSRDSSAALERLRTVCLTSDNANNRQAYEAFAALTEPQQRELVNAIHVLDGAPTIVELAPAIERRLALSVRPEHAPALRERLEGWWYSRVIDHLREHGTVAITFNELQGQILDLTEQFRPGALPIDFVDEEPQSGHEYANRQFVGQLRLIRLGQERIQLAIRDYYKAYSQRSRWMRESLLGLGELDRYERHLITEWANVFEMACEDAGDSASDEELVEAGRRTYKWVTVDARFPIRRNCTEAYVMRGSYHMLADETSPQVGWHPSFRAHFCMTTGENTP